MILMIVSQRVVVVLTSPRWFVSSNTNSTSLPSAVWTRSVNSHSIMSLFGPNNLVTDLQNKFEIQKAGMKA